MTQENEYTSDQAIWWILQRIKRELQKTAEENRVRFFVHALSNEPAYLVFTHQEIALKELQQKEALTFYEVSHDEIVIIGTTEYAITILQPKFDQVFADYEAKLSPAIDKRYALDFNGFSEDLRNKILLPRLQAYPIR